VSVDSLTDEEQAVLAETLSAAPVEFKEALEAKINVYGGGFDQYVPVDSKVTVATRRSVGAAIVSAFIAPVAVAAAGKKE